MPSAALVAGEVLLPGQRLRHEVGAVSAVMCGDGNLLVLRDSDEAPLWQSGTSDCPGASVAVRDDGEIGLWWQGRLVWTAGTAGHPGAFLELQADGRLLVYDFFRHLLWSSLEP